MKNKQILKANKSHVLWISALLLLLGSFVVNAQQNQTFDLSVSVELSVEVGSDFTVHIVGFSSGGITQTQVIENSTIVVFNGIQADTYDVFVTTGEGDVVLKSLVELDANKEIVLSEQGSK